MPKFSAKNIEFKDDQQAIFGTDDDSYISWKGSTDQLVVSTTLSGIDPTDDGHLTTKKYVDDEISDVYAYIDTVDTTTSGFSHLIMFPADLVVGNPPSPTYSTLDPIAAYVFDDAKDENVYGGFSIPEDWKDNSSISIRVCYMVDSTQTGVKDCRWVLSYQTYMCGDLYGSKTTTVYSLDSSLPSGAVAGLYMTDVFGSKMLYNDTNNPFGQQSTVMFMFEREGSHVNDTMFDDAVLMRLVFTYETEAT